MLRVKEPLSRPQNQHFNYQMNSVYMAQNILHVYTFLKMSYFQPQWSEATRGPSRVVFFWGGEADAHVVSLIFCKFLVGVLRFAVGGRSGCHAPTSTSTPSRATDVLITGQ